MAQSELSAERRTIFGVRIASLLILTTIAVAAGQESARTSESLPIASAAFKKAALAAFRAVTRVPDMVVDSEDQGEAYHHRKLDAEKGVDAATDAAETDSDKQILQLLTATMKMRELSRLDVPKYGRTAVQCTNELYAIFDPDSQRPEMKEIARKGTCLLDSRRLIDELYSKPTTENARNNQSLVTAQQDHGNWQFKADRDPMDDQPRYSLQADADETVAGVTPILVIRCDAPKQRKDGWGRKRTSANADVFVVTHLPLHGQELHTLRVRFDEDKAQMEPWRDAESLDAIFHEYRNRRSQSGMVNAACAQVHSSFRYEEPR
jgi:hypothetical protein